MILRRVTYVKENLIIFKKVSTTKIFKKLKILIIVYTEVQDILYGILDTADREIYLF